MILAAALVTALAAGSLVGAARAHIDDNAPTCGNFATGDFFDADTLRALFDVDTMIDAWPGQCKRIAMYQDTGFWWCNVSPARSKRRKKTKRKKEKKRENREHCPPPAPET